MKYYEQFSDPPFGKDPDEVNDEEEAPPLEDPLESRGIGKTSRNLEEDEEESEDEK